MKRGRGPALFGKWTAGAPAQAPFNDWPDTVAGYGKQGFTSWRYREAGRNARA